MSNKVTYKNYNMNQLQMPMDITDWIEENHISKLINQVVDVNVNLNMTKKFKIKMYILFI